MNDVEAMSNFEEVRDCEIIAPYVNNLPKFMSMALPKGSPYVKAFDEAIFRLMESGIFDLLKTKWEATRSNCISVTSVEFQAIGFEKIISLFVFFAVGVVVSVVLSTFEGLMSLCVKGSVGDAEREEEEYLESVLGWIKDRDDSERRRHVDKVIRYARKLEGRSRKK